MVRHVVMFDYYEEAEGASAMENAAKAKEMLLGLKDKIDVLRYVEVGLNSPQAEQKNFKLVLICDFDTMEDLNTYVVHPEHVKVGEFMRKVRNARSCVDYEF